MSDKRINMQTNCTSSSHLSLFICCQSLYSLNIENFVNFVSFSKLETRGWWQSIQNGQRMENKLIGWFLWCFRKKEAALTVFCWIIWMISRCDKAWKGGWVILMLFGGSVKRASRPNRRVKIFSKYSSSLSRRNIWFHVLDIYSPLLCWWSFAPFGYLFTRYSGWRAFVHSMYNVYLFGQTRVPTFVIAATVWLWGSEDQVSVCCNLICCLFLCLSLPLSLS